MLTLTIVRGIQGEGKAAHVLDYLARNPQDSVDIDDFFIRNSKYTYRPQKLPTAYSWCRQLAGVTLFLGRDFLISAPFLNYKELEVFSRVAEISKAKLEVVEFMHQQESARIPNSALKRMEGKWLSLPVVVERVY